MDKMRMKIKNNILQINLGDGWYECSPFNADVDIEFADITFRFFRKQKSPFKKALRNIKVGDIVRVEGATKEKVYNGEFPVTKIFPQGMFSVDNSCMLNCEWLYRKKDGKIWDGSKEYGRITAIQTKPAEWVEG